MNCVKTFFWEISKFSSCILSLAFLYWGLIQLYIYLCVPTGYMAPFHTLINLGSPLCLFINKFQYEVANHYVTIWWVSGGSFIYYMLSRIGSLTNGTNLKDDKDTNKNE